MDRLQIEGDDKKFDKVLEAFERFCSPQKNILYEHHGFWIMRQEDSESVDSYLTRLKLKVSMTRLVGLQQ